MTGKGRSLLDDWLLSPTTGSDLWTLRSSYTKGFFELSTHQLMRSSAQMLPPEYVESTPTLLIAGHQFVNSFAVVGRGTLYTFAAM
jgi:hypothetical protein